MNHLDTVQFDLIQCIAILLMAFFHFSLSPGESVPAPTVVAACQPPVHGQVVQVQVGGGQTAGVGVVKHLQRRKAKIITRDSRALSDSSITHIPLFGQMEFCYEVYNHSPTKH